MLPRIAIAHGGLQRVERWRRPDVLEGLHHPAHDLLLLLRPFREAFRTQYAFQRRDQVQLEVLGIRVGGDQRGDRHVRCRVHRDQVLHLPAERRDLVFHARTFCALCLACSRC
jgi:hypothetical protein